MRGTLPSLAHSERVWLGSYRRSGNGVIIGNNNTKNALQVMFIVRKSPMNRRYIVLLFRLKFLPLLFLTYCPPWAVQSRRDVREHPPPAAEPHFSVQQIAHPSMFPKAPLSNYTAPPGSLLRELYKSPRGKRRS